MNGLLRLLGRPSAFYIKDSVLRCDNERVNVDTGQINKLVVKSYFEGVTV